MGGTVVEGVQKNGNPGKPASTVGLRRLRMEIPQSYPLFLCTTSGLSHAVFVTKTHANRPSVGHGISPGQNLGNTLKTRMNTGFCEKAHISRPMNGNRPVTFASLKYGFRRRQVAGLVNRQRTIPVQSRKSQRDTRCAGTPPSTDERHADNPGYTTHRPPPHLNSPSSPLTGCPPPTPFGMRHCCTQAASHHPHSRMCTRMHPFFPGAVRRHASTACNQSAFRLR